MSAATVSVAGTAAADAGASFLVSRLGPDGAVPNFLGADYDATAQTALALAAAGGQPVALARTADFLAAHVDDYVRSGGVDQPGRLARLVMIAVALGRDPHAFGGTDLLVRIGATQVSAGTQVGRYGDANPLAGAYIQSLVLAALHAVGTADPIGTAWLVAQQCPDGSWTGSRVDLTQPCDDAHGTAPDTNNTAMAVMGLVAQGATATHDPLVALRAAQTATGWKFGPTSPSTDPNSSALAVQAILASGGDPRSATYTVGGVSAFDALLGYQLGCDRPAGDRGGFWYDYGQIDDRTTPNVLATAQAVPAAAGQSFPLAAPVERSPLDACASSATTTTTLADPTSSTTTTSTTSTSTTSTSTVVTTTVVTTTTTTTVIEVPASSTSTPSTESPGARVIAAATVTRPGGQVAVRGARVVRSPANTSASNVSRTTSLARTGSDDAAPLAVGLASLVLGSLLLVCSTRLRRRP